MQKITLIGRLGKDVAIRETQDGGKFLSFSVAVNSYSRNVEKTHWFEVTAFNYDRYRKMAKYLTKGSSIIVTGDLDADLEKGDDGKTYIRRRVVADSLEFNSNGSGSTNETRTEETTTRKSRRQEEVPDDIDEDEMEMDTKPRKKRRDEEEDEEEAPKPKKRSKPADDDEDEDEPKPRKRKAVEPAEDDEDDEPKPKKR